MVGVAGEPEKGFAGQEGAMTVPSRRLQSQSSKPEAPALTSSPQMLSWG